MPRLKGNGGMSIKTATYSGYASEMDTPVSPISNFYFVSPNGRYLVQACMLIALAEFIFTGGNRCASLNNVFCPNEQCRDYGLRNQGNLAAHGKYGKDIAVIFFTATPVASACLRPGKCSIWPASSARNDSSDHPPRGRFEDACGLDIGPSTIA